jgi:hypothetical protein
MDSQSFSLFPRLALEIRLAIWSYAMIPAVVYIKPVGNPRNKNVRKQENSSLLRVCRESRIAALRQYELASDIDKTYVNFDLDTIYIDYTDSYDLDSLPLYPSGNEARFRYLAIDMHWINFLGMDFLINKVIRCPNLRQLTFVVKFTQALNIEGETGVLAAAVKYEDLAETVAEARLIEIIDGRNDDLPMLIELYELISFTWVYLVRKHFPGKERWPKISLIAQPSIIF